MKKLIIAVLCLAGVYSENRGAEASPADLGQQLVKAARTRNLSEVRKLIEAGADLNASDMNRWTPLIHATNNGSTELVKMLLGAGANPNIADTDGDTALHYATTQLGRRGMEDESPQIEILQALLRAGADVNAGGFMGTTPLMRAAMRYEYPQVTRTLLDADADPFLLDDNGRTALDFARTDEVKQMIQDAIEERKKEAKQAILEAQEDVPEDIAGLIVDIAYGETKKQK